MTTNSRMASLTLLIQSAVVDWILKQLVIIYRHGPFLPNGRISLYFLLIYFFWTFFSSVCCCQYELLCVLFRYSRILISFNVLVYQVNMTKVDVSVEIELWRRSISHDRSKLNTCNFHVYVHIYNITYFVLV